MLNVSVTLYKFEELSDKAQQRAIQEHRAFLLTIMHPDDFISGDPEYDTPEELQSAYEAEYEYYLSNDDPIIESIECNGYYFFCDGTLANTTTYVCGPNAGRILVDIHGETDLLIIEEEQR